MRLKALLFHLRDDTHEINPDMCDVFSDLLTRENWELISAYELYLLTDDKEDLVDTLFTIYKLYSGGGMPDDDDDQDQKLLKDSLETILFGVKGKLDSKVYDKLLTLVKVGDIKTKELHDTYRRDKDEKKFIAELTNYAQEKIKRTSQLTKNKAGQPKDKKEEEKDWQEELLKIIELYKQSIPVPDIMIPAEIVSCDLQVAEAIYRVYKLTEDRGDTVESLNVLKNRVIREHIEKYYLESMSFISPLIKHRIDYGKILKAIDDYNSKANKKLREAVELFEALEEEDDFVDSFRRIYRIPAN